MGEVGVFSNATFLRDGCGWAVAGADDVPAASASLLEGRERSADTDRVGWWNICQLNCDPTDAGQGRGEEDLATWVVGLFHLPRVLRCALVTSH